MPNFYYHFLLASRFLKKSHKWDRNKLVDYQNRKLIEMVRHAGKNVPYYRDLFHKIGLDPANFRGIEDIEKIPLLDKEEIRKDPVRFCADNYEKYGGQWTKTSGSTGTPLKLRIDNLSKAWKYAATLRAYKLAGYSYYKKALVVQGYSESKKEPFGYRPVTNSLYYNSSRVNEKTVLDFYPLLMKHRPRIIIGYTRPVALMLDMLKSNNLELPPVKSIINYGENLREETVAYFKKILDCKVFDFYSQTENAVMIHSFPDGSLRLIEDYFFPEILEDSSVPEPGGSGELVGTSFYNYAMPLIRYKTRDIVATVKSAQDDNAFKKIASVEGRKDDMIILPNGGRVTLVEGAICCANGIIAAQYLQEKTGILKIHLVVDKEFKEEYFKDIEKALRVRLGDSMTFEFNIVDELEKRGSGKIPFIINKLDKN